MGSATDQFSTPPPYSPKRLLYIQDRNSGRNFLVDTGAEVSVIPATPSDRRMSPAKVTLRAANGTDILAYGSRNLPLRFGNRYFQWECQVAAVSQPLLGADFLRAHNLLVDVAGRQLVDPKDFTSICLQPTIGTVPHLSSVAAATDAYAKKLAEFPEVVEPSFHLQKTKHGVEHFILTTGPPIHSRARRLPPDKLAFAKAEFARMEKAGIIRRSKREWASPLHMVPKDGGSSWRPCGDYRRVNNVTTPDRYPVPHIQDFASNLAGCKILSKIDLVKGYHHIPVREEDIPKTAVITPFGLFEFLRMPFGLRNAAQAFQQLMDTVLGGFFLRFCVPGRHPGC